MEKASSAAVRTFWHEPCKAAGVGAMPIVLGKGGIRVRYRPVLLGRLERSGGNPDRSFFQVNKFIERRVP
jgi:hypothetical protein